MNPNNVSQGHLLKIEWLVANVTPVGSPARAEHDVLGLLLLDVGWPIQAIFLVEKSLCDIAIPSWVLVSLLRVIK